MPVKYSLSTQNQRKFARACPSRLCAFAFNDGGFNGEFFVFQKADRRRK
jgi:hypothetical protein